MVFRLASVLEHRQRQTEELEIALAALLRQVASLETSRAGLINERENIRSQIGGSGRLNLEEISHKLGYLTMVERRLAENAQAISEMLLQVDLKRAEVGEALKEQKKVEKLRDRGMEKAAIDERLADTRLSDELGMIGFNAQQRGIA